MATFEESRDLSNHAGIVYTFFSERGRQDMSYAQYLKDAELRWWVCRKERYRLVLGRTVFTYSMDWLSAHRKTALNLRELEEEQRRNPLQFYAPSGNEALAFLNDFDNDLCILTACNRYGKTNLVLVKKIINNIPCDPDWDIFTKYGVVYRQWMGPTNVGLSSYDLGFHTDTTLPMLLAWLPKSELGPYSPDYKGKGARKVTMRVEPKLPLECGTTFMFASMSQGQAPFEGNVKHDWGWDEQGTEAAFDGADERTRTTYGGRHDFGLTPHKVDGRPDTGAGSWISKITGGSLTKGRSIGLYHGQVWDVPDWIYPEAAKAMAYEKWVVEPTRNMDDKARREGLARFFGRWHEASGLVIDEWDSTKHVIDPFKIPPHWSLFRAYDHGSKHPAACLWGAVNPGGDLFIYRDWLRTGLVPSQVAVEIIERSGNKRRKIGTYRSPKTGHMYDKYEEIQSGEAFQWTVMDARAFSQDSSGEGIALASLYSMAGLKMRQGSGKGSDAYVPLIKEWFALDAKKKHVVTGELGAPRVYVFSTCHELIKTIKRWTWEERKTRGDAALKKESPSKKDDDLCDCLKLMLQAGPRFRGNPRMTDAGHYDENVYGDSEFVVSAPVDALTGY